MKPEARVFEIILVEKDHLGDWSPEKTCCLGLMFQQYVRKPSQSEDTRPPHRKLIGESTGHRSDDLIKYEKDNEKVQTNVSPNTRFLSWNRQQ